MPIIPKEFPDFTQLGPVATAEMQRMYEEGYVGAKYNPQAQEQLRSEAEYAYASDAAHANDFADAHKGKLVIPFRWVEEYYPGCWPGPGQECGDCVSHGQKNACLGTLCGEIKIGLPDAVSGKRERAPEIPPLGIKNGAFSTEAIYWWRRHGGDGWSCSESTRVVIRESGLWIRKTYPELGIDLSDYSANLAHKYGRTPPSGEIARFGREHLFRTSTEADTFEEVRDLLGQGFFLNSCGSEGFESKRDANGVSDRRGSWAHSMAIIGADDRPEIHKAYPGSGGLVLILNSWAIFNSGPRRILGTNIDIPQGSFWARWSDVRRRSYIAISGANGWAREKVNWEFTLK